MTQGPLPWGQYSEVEAEVVRVVFCVIGFAIACERFAIKL